MRYDKTLKKLQEAWKEMEKVEESATYKGTAKGGITPKSPGASTKPVTGVQREEGAKGRKASADKYGEKGSVNDKVKCSKN
jgi:hypothetical protein